jgi:hypothetical protein
MTTKKHRREQRSKRARQMDRIILYVTDQVARPDVIDRQLQEPRERLATPRERRFIR